MSPEAFAIRDHAFELVSGSGLFQTVKNSIVQQMEPGDQFPAATVFLLREVRVPDGDANHGEPRFVNDLTLGVVITIDSGDQNRLESVLADYTNRTINLILTDPDFVADLEGIVGLSESQSFPPSGETYYGEARVEMTVQYRTKFEPLVEDDFLRTRITTRPINHPDAPAIRTTINHRQP
ncbi:hypothetical protein [Methylobacterium oryzisoli]|uniref:hypothetical protein n=1 Tax=Methylobacterium oryzisoli TaxID=3385502 RepID=UPI00389246B8